MRDPVYVVSGLPRSGTSMMMRALATGGAPLLVDDARPADGDNPHGYFELAAVKATARDASWVRDAPGRVVKVISHLLPYLPAEHEYRVVFMRRRLDQVVRSQRAMLSRLTGVAPDDTAATRRSLADHLVEIEAWLESVGHVRVLGVSYEQTVAAPGAQVARIADFLGLALDRAAMVTAIEPALHRQR
jgi:hypothetical protein